MAQSRGQINSLESSCSETPELEDIPRAKNKGLDLEETSGGSSATIEP